MKNAVKKILKHVTMLVVAYQLLALPVWGQVHKTGTTSANFLKIGVDARSLGLAGAVVGMTGNVLSLYWNPAAIGFIPHTELGFMHHRYVQDMAHEFAVFTTHINPDWNFALSFSYFNAGAMDKTERTAPGEFVQTGTFSASDFSPTITSAYRVRKNLNLGVSLKPIFEAIDIYHGQTLALDFGGLYAANGFGLGMAVRNIGPGLSLSEKSFDLPRIFSLGGSYQFQKFALLAAELEKPADNSLLTKIGIELTPLKLFSLRTGYAFGPMNNELKKIAGFAAGMGFRVRNFAIDYAFNPMGVFGNSHRISLIYSFLQKTEPGLDVFAQPEKISPDNDGVDDFCTFLFNSQFCEPIKKWGLNLMDESKNTVKTWKGNGAIPEKLIWYGETHDGEPAPAGRYVYVFSVLCGSNQFPLERKGSVLIDVKKGNAPMPQPVAEKQGEKMIFTLSDILFDLNRTTIRPQNEFYLNKVVDFLITHPNARVIVSGHTDNLANNEYNMQLSLARANAVKNYLLRQTKLNPENIQTQGFGKTQPIVPNNSESNRQKNRRVEIVFFYSRDSDEIQSDVTARQNRNASVAQVQKIINLVQVAALEYDVYYGAAEIRLKEMARDDAQRAENIARAEAEMWGYGLVKKIVDNERSLYEIMAGIEYLKENIDWKRIYSAWNGRLVDVSEIYKGQALFILYKMNGF